MAPEPPSKRAAARALAAAFVLLLGAVTAGVPGGRSQLPDAFSDLPCAAEVLYGNGRGPILIAGDFDLMPPAGTLNGVCLGDGGHDHRIPALDISAGPFAPSTDPRTLLPDPRPLLEIRNTTQTLLVDGTRLSGLPGETIVLDAVQGVDLLGIAAPDLTLVLRDVRNVTVVGSQLGAVEVEGGRGITIADSTIGSAAATAGPAIVADGVDGLQLRNLALHSNATAPLVDSTNSSLVLQEVRTPTGPPPNAPCLRVSDAPWLQVVNVSLGARCPAGLLQASGAAIEVDGLAGTVGGAATAAASIAATGPLALQHLLLAGGVVVLDLAGSTGSWSLVSSNLTGAGAALLALGAGAGAVHRSELRGNAALFEARGTTAPATRPIVAFTDNRVVRDLPESVLATGLAFDSLVDLRLWEEDPDAPDGNVRGGPRRGGNWWIRSGLDLWDGDHDGFAQTPVPLSETSARDERPLVPVNWAPNVTAALRPDPADPFVRVTEAQQLTLEAAGADPEDGPLSDLFWVVDGTIHVGASHVLQAPAPGPHVATAYARDAQGALAQAPFKFTVLVANVPPTAEAPVVRPCGQDAQAPPTLREGQQACFDVAANDLPTDDWLDLLYLDGGDLAVGAGDVRLGRSLEPPVLPGPVGAGFDLAVPLLAGPSGAHVVLAQETAVLRLGAGTVVQAGDLVLGGPGQGSRLQPHHALAGAAGQAACAPMPFGLAGAAAYLDLDCSQDVSPGDHRLGNPGGGPVGESDPALGETLAAAPGNLARFDRDATLRVLWSLDVGTASQSAAGASATLTPLTPGNGFVTAVVSDLGELAATLVQTTEVAVQSNQPPQAAFVASPMVQGTGMRVFRNQPITLTDTSIAPPATPITSWSWLVTGPSGTFGGTQRTMAVQFTDLGEHVATLAVQAANGQSDVHEATVTVLQAPPSPFAEAVPQVPRPAGTPIAFTAQGSSDLDDELEAVGTGLGLLRRPQPASAHDAWVVDADDNRLEGAGDQVVRAAGDMDAAPTPGTILEDVVDVRVCLADLDGNGAPSRGRGIEGLFLTQGPCTATKAGDTRLQPAYATAGTLAAGTTMASGQSDVGLTVVNVSAARLASHPSSGIMLDLDGDLQVDADDLRIAAADGRRPFTRVLPASFADAGGSLGYAWRCIVGCGAGAQALSDDPAFAWAFPTSGRKVIELKVTDASLNVVQQTLDIIVANTAPVADFTFAPAGLPAGRSYVTQLDDIRFDGTPSYDADGGVGDLQYRWVFGDGETSTLPVVTKRFPGPGTYTANLTVTDGDDVAPRSQMVSKTVTILNHLPIPAFQQVPEAPLSLTPVAFDARTSVDPDGAIASPGGFRWTIQEGDTTSTVVGPLASHAFARAGTYTVTLEVTDDRASATALTRTVTVANRAPTAVITVDRTVGRAPQTLQFSADQSTDPEVEGAAGIAAVLWDFGDGSTSTQFNPAHTFSRRGLFVVRLTVADVDGGSATASVNVNMLNEPAIASMVLPTSAMVGKPAAFKALAYDQDGDAVTFAWDLGDGTTRVGAFVNHTYGRHGAFPIALRAHDAGGGETLVTRLLNVASPAPVATLGASKAEVLVNEPVSFVGNATDDGRVLGHFLDFGDGTSEFRANATHKYAKAGNYTVTYRASDDAGESGAARVTVRVVNPAPRIVSLDVTPADAKPGDLLLFRAVVEDEEPGVQYEWDFKDGAVSDQATPVHVYRVAGTFNVVLQVEDAHGVKATRSLDVTVTQRGLVLQPNDVAPAGGAPGVDRVGHQDLPAPPWGLVGLAALAAVAFARRRT